MYKEFGIAIKAYRVAANESIEDVSGAVEVDPSTISEIEEGKLQPPMDILELLIRHFSLRHNEALRLWKLAGYAKNGLEKVKVSADPKKQVQIATDAPIMYTDSIHVAANKYGITLSFIQGIGADGDPVVVSRVGMSSEHAQSMLNIIRRALEKQSRE